jgi:hypothetical protein
MTDRPARTEEPPYATVTVLTFPDRGRKSAALAGLRELIDGTADLAGLDRVAVLDTGPAEATMVTFYRSQRDAERASAGLRPQLGAAVGDHVAGPPQRRAGPVLFDG